MCATLYDNTFVRQKWLPDFLKMPLTRLLCPLCLWVFNSLEAIPVYRNNPRALIKTFRLTVEAMQGGRTTSSCFQSGAKRKNRARKVMSPKAWAHYTQGLR